MGDLPERWSDEPWPLEDPVPSPSLRPTNWSDTHTDPPQVADLADEAWEYAIDHGCSIGQALHDLQRIHMKPAWKQDPIAVLEPSSFINLADPLPTRFPDPNSPWIWSGVSAQPRAVVGRSGSMSFVGQPPVAVDDVIEAGGETWRVTRIDFETDDDGTWLRGTAHLRAEEPS